MSKIWVIRSFSDFERYNSMIVFLLKYFVCLFYCLFVEKKKERKFDIIVVEEI